MWIIAKQILNFKRIYLAAVRDEIFKNSMEHGA
jgi:hypothetical protein